MTAVFQKSNVSASYKASLFVFVFHSFDVFEFLILTFDYGRFEFSSQSSIFLLSDLCVYPLSTNNYYLFACQGIFKS